MSAKLLKIKYSTAKFIAKQYETSGIVTDHRNRTTPLKNIKNEQLAPESSISSE